MSGQENVSKKTCEPYAKNARPLNGQWRQQTFTLLVQVQVWREPRISQKGSNFWFCFPVISCENMSKEIQANLKCLINRYNPKHNSL